MKDYTHFSVADFTQDHDFLRWVKYGDRDPELNKKWSDWLQLHPEKQETVEEAKKIIQAVVKEKQFPLTELKQREMWARIAITAAGGVQPALSGQTRAKRSFAWYGVAAAVTLTTLVSVLLFQSRDTQFTKSGPKTNDPVLAGEQLVRFVNEGGKPQTLTLPDGSRISLQPNSVIHYPEFFTETRRDLYLSGEAFFDVARDPKKPFSVCTSELVTQVLGTSFTVRAYEAEKNIVVAVRTGKVSVFTETAHTPASAADKLEGALLTPNQQITFSKDESRMIKSLVKNPVVLSDSVGKDRFHFVDTPIREVFSLFEEAYGVEIVYDEEVMTGCYLNASLNDISFYDKLKYICRGIDARYEILDAHIIISGNGCH